MKDIKNKIEKIDKKLEEINSIKNDLLISDLFYKSKIALNILSIDSFSIEPLPDIVNGNVFEGFELIALEIYDPKNDDYHDFNNILDKESLSLSDLEIGPLLKKAVKVTTSMTIDEFKSQFKRYNKNKM